MRLRSVSPILFPLLFLACLDSAISAGSPRFLQTNHWVVAEDFTESGELWVQAGMAEAEGALERSLFLIAETARLDGLFAQDVWVAGADVQFNGTALQNVRMASTARIHVGGTVQGIAMAVALESIETDPAAVIREGALFVARTVTLEGRIGADAVVRAFQARVGGHIEGDLLVDAAKIQFIDGARIDGDVWVRAPLDTEPPNVLIGGSIRTLPSASAPRHTIWSREALLYAGALLTGLLMLALFPGGTGRAVRQIRRGFWRSALTGAAAFVLSPLLVLLLGVTLIGLPAAALLAGLHLALLYCSKIVVALALGGALLRRAGPQPLPTALAALALGLLFLYIAANLPIVGTVVVLCIWLTGLGGLILGAFAVPLNLSDTGTPLRPGATERISDNP